GERWPQWNVVEAACDFGRRNILMVFEVCFAPDKKGCAHIVFVAPRSFLEDGRGVIDCPAGSVVICKKFLQLCLVAHILMIRFAAATLIRKRREEDWTAIGRQHFERCRHMAY